MAFKVGNEIIKNKGISLKYRITRINKIGDIPLIWGYRIKYDWEKKTWVSFGQERALLGRDYRLITEDDYHYFK